MVEKAASGHPGGAMGGADLFISYTVNFSVIMTMVNGCSEIDFTWIRVTCPQCYIQN